MWEPQPGAQSSAILADWCDELFYGGERGGGKSDFQLGYQEDGALQYEGKSRGIMFRKTYTELEELQSRAIEIFPCSGAIYKVQSSVEYPFSNCWYWANGATVKMRFIEHERDYGRYHGHQYSHLSQDEVTEYPTDKGYLKMLSTLRNANGVPCTSRLTGNPGGAGHAWVKARYIDPSSPMTPFTDADTGFTRMFIPSKLNDNQILLASDPNYRQRIRAATAGNEVLRKAWEKGDWDIVAGAFFSNWTKDNIIRPFSIPDGWLRFMSGDWGSAKPFSFGWWAIASDDTFVNDIWIPRGAMVRYREWYGCKKDANGVSMPDVGLKLHASEVGEGLKERNLEKLDYSVIDPAAFAEDGGPSIVERITTKGIYFSRADNKRVATRGAMGGWDQMSERLAGEDFGEPMGIRPMIYCFDTCTDSTRTIPVLQHDERRAEDLDTTMEDHAADEWRYACMSRPWVKSASNKGSKKEDRWAKAFNKGKSDSWKTV